MIRAILKYSIESLLWGGLITGLFLFLFVFLIKGWYKDAIFKPISFVVFGVLSLIILWNSTIICGALSMKSDISSIQSLIENAIVSSGIDMNSTIDALKSGEIFQEVIAKHPILNYYADYCDFSGWSVAELPSAMCNTLKEYLNGIIVKCVLWSLGFVIIGTIIVVKTLDRGSSNRISSRNYYRTNIVASRNTGGTKRIASRNIGSRRSSRT